MNNFNPEPPKLLLNILRWFCREEWVEEIEGDLTELFHEESRIKSHLRARILFSFRALGFFKPQNLEFIHSNFRMMLLNNYLIIARRNLVRNKGYTLFNLVGFSIGLMAGFLMLLYVSDELSYDRHYTRSEDIYRAVEHIYMEGGRMHSAAIPGPVGSQLMHEMPEIESWATFTFMNRVSFEVNGEKFTDPNGRLVSSTYLDVFDHPFIIGDPTTALKTPGSVVISESRALNYFGSTDILGHTLKSDHFGTFTITGIMEDPKPNSHFHMHFLFHKDDEFFITDSEDHSYYSYIKLNEQADVDPVRAKLPAFYQQYLAQSVHNVFSASGDLFLQPITDIHLNSDLAFEIEPNGKKHYVIAMASLAFFILVVLCINYTNMATAQATRRVREVGVRKVLGGNGRMIIHQFFTESGLLIGISSVVALLSIPIILPYFNYISGKTLTMDLLMTMDNLFIFITIVVVTGILSASYPAFFLSRFNASEILKKSYSLGRMKLPISKILNSMQFAVALVMVMMTWTLYEQINFIRETDLGFESDQVIKISLNQRLDMNSLVTYRSELMAISGVTAVSFAKQSPGEAIMSDGLEFEKPGGGQMSIKTAFNAVDDRFFDVLKMNIRAGSTFSESSPAMWGHEAVVNRALVDQLGYQNPEGILDTKVQLPLGDDHFARIVGVVDNAHFESLHHKVSPYIMVNFLPITSTILARVEGQNLNSTFDQMDRKMAQITNSTSHEITLLNQQYWAQYEADEMQQSILSVFSGLVVFLAFTGLIGLVSLHIRFKAKEINIRKVFGASFRNIMSIYSRQYGKQFIFSILIAVPIALVLITNWLENFAYHIALPLSQFGLLVCGMMLMVLLIVSFHCWKSISVNPTIHLREE